MSLYEILNSNKQAAANPTKARPSKSDAILQLNFSPFNRTAPHPQNHTMRVALAAATHSKIFPYTLRGPEDITHHQLHEYIILINEARWQLHTRANPNNNFVRLRSSAANLFFPKKPSSLRSLSRNPNKLLPFQTFNSPLSTSTSTISNSEANGEPIKKPKQTHIKFADIHHTVSLCGWWMMDGRHTNRASYDVLRSIRTIAVIFCG